MEAVSEDELAELLAEPEVGLTLTYHYPAEGPTRNIGYNALCDVIHVTGKSCNKPASHLVEGKPRCVICSIRALTELIVKERNETTDRS